MTHRTGNGALRILIISYSRTGTTWRLAEEAADLIRRSGHHVSRRELTPVVDLPYPFWLILSFVPGSRFPNAGSPPEVAGFDACLLALPKWTFSCPPVNSFLARRAFELPSTALLVTCGGWDQERYLAALTARLGRTGVHCLGGMWVKRSEMGTQETANRLADFVNRCFPWPNGGRASPHRGEDDDTSGRELLSADPA